MSKIDCTVVPVDKLMVICEDGEMLFAAMPKVVIEKVRRCDDLERRIGIIYKAGKERRRLLRELEKYGIVDLSGIRKGM